MRNLPLFAAFEAADLAVFVTRFTWFGRLQGLGGASLGAFQVALAVRAAVLVACLVAWVLQGKEEIAPAPDRSAAPALLEPESRTA